MEEKKGNDLIIGRNCLSEALRGNRTLDRVLVIKGFQNGSLRPLVAKAKESGAVIKEVDGRKLDLITGGASHQGIVAYAAVREYAQVDDIFSLAKEKNEDPFLIVLDEIEDPHNLGAVIRTAECAGAHGVIIPRRRSVGLSYTVGKASAGAVEYMPVARVTNIADTLEALKKRGVWVYGADMDGQVWCKADLKGAIALVIGSEGRGISRLVREKCDAVLSLPMRGNITSLNASVAAGVLMYEITRQRMGL